MSPSEEEGEEEVDVTEGNGIPAGTEAPTVAEGVGEGGRDRCPVEEDESRNARIVGVGPGVPVVQVRLGVTSSRRSGPGGVEDHSRSSPGRTGETKVQDVNKCKKVGLIYRILLPNPIPFRLL